MTEAPEIASAPSRLERLAAWLGARHDAAGLAAFRVLFGLLCAASATRFLAYGWIDPFFVTPRFTFRYWAAPFVEPLSSTGMHAVFAALVVAGLCVAAGLFYRAAIVATFVGFTYVQLVDVTNYLNHYYLVSLLAGLLALMPANAAWSVDARLFPSVRSATTPAWCTYLLRFQVGTVYTFAGLAKVTSDWLLHAQPLQIWLAARTGTPVLGPLLAHPWAPWFMAWAGCLFDLTIAFWLLSRRTRPYAYAVVLGFHAATRALFPIGMFPVIMVVAATAFFDPSWPRALAARLGVRRPAWLAIPERVPGSGRVTPAFRGALALAAAFAAFQVLFPLRTHLYGGNVLWHEQGMRLSWRVMVREKNASVTYLVTNPRTHKTHHVSPRLFLDWRQEREFGTQPDLLLQLAHRIGEEYARREGGPVEVRADVLASLNGRPAARLVDPEVDLMTVSDGFAPKPWVLPAPTSEPPHLRSPSTDTRSARR